MKKILYKIRKRFARGYGEDIDYSIMKNMLKENSDIKVIDVRTQDEYNFRHIQGAINIQLQDITTKIQNVVSNKDDIIIVYCEYGGRSGKALNKLKKMGYTNVYNLDGGIEAII